MCGRFVRKSRIDEIVWAFAVDEVAADVAPSYNIAPTQDVVALIAANGKRRLGALRWGLIPFWAKEVATGNKMINARAESVMEKVSFRKPFLHQRCLIVANGFYEWKRSGTTKVPVYIRLKSDMPFAFAGLYDTWTSPAGERISSCTILTTGANELLRDVHHRMPVILNETAQEIWLDRTMKDPAPLQSVLQPYPPDQMELFEVSTRVNSVKNDDAGLIEPVS
ncbi:MAG: SOS response-associated peptidase [Gemmatimonadetes bacterium]|nr:MAG: SOS response-associated peptidase [Gemmatimonadota bacterium]